MLDHRLQSKLVDLCHLLIDQRRARVIVPPYDASSGFWFGGGNMAVGPQGDLYLVGRYRNHGDSRTGLAAGSRGLELAIFRSRDQGRSFEKVVGMGKQELSPGETPVLSIEGSAIRFSPNSVELYVSTEKDRVGYPPEFQRFLKPGTGVWSIDRIDADSVEGLKDAAIVPWLVSKEPETIHVKDPFLYETPTGPLLLFCSHPFNWSCSNTGFVPADAAVPRDDSVSSETSGASTRCESATFDFFPRGNVWDVAMTRGTAVIDVPALGAFLGQNVQLMFYDGGECVRDHTQHAESVARPRGHSCEELGGAAVFLDRRWQQPQRLSRYEPLFVSPFGTGCSRYVDVLDRPEGMYATWQQSQPDGSQPLVLHFVPRSEIESVLA
ncbi:hypothetical protein Enr13x_06530 [Stieleria neptunia]|uniref:Exo-alpha-sialidase n=1 Tax=Stieleria neptunia TaxID=2527979 RepID=A0A518HIZ2_9BACT|nr:exo-alpha-sialidase [Stieleria neptunia]QDV40817.1 hypothetical protein Enr13x_06530 [Stieleria neptunia]